MSRDYPADDVIEDGVVWVVINTNHTGAQHYTYLCLLDEDVEEARSKELAAPERRVEG